MTNTTIFEEFEQRIARPIAMEDYSARDGRFAGREGPTEGGESIHPNHIFSMTARAMDRFGYLYVRGGRWKDEHTIPADWWMSAAPGE